METVPERVLEITERFDYNRKAYLSGHFNETQVRHEFIDPLFECLGWDVNNRQGYAEAYKDVIHEDAIKIGRATKAPDYCFRVGGTRKFFVEAKKPSLDLRDDPAPAFQLRRYAWSAKLPLSILTDFEEFAIYDCRVKPDISDRPSTARTLYLHYHDYAERWSDIASIFSREAVLKGAFDQYADSVTEKHGTSEVDTVFLRQIESWRDMLARNIARRNPKLSQRELNFAVQVTIDRIVFLRIAEDRGIEDYGCLLAQQNGQHVYDRLIELFRQADARYNSGLFHFVGERGELEAPDRLTPSLRIDDQPLREIVSSLYYPESPYEFSVLPADILGHVYEQFLGKVIRLTPRHQAVIEEKPEVRKSGGVYYTPSYIVGYIVRETVGKLVEGKKPGPRGGASRLKIVDPACGSGSFLIGAYEYLLDWHRDQYVGDGPERHTRELYQVDGAEWRLTIDERKRILLNNIYGVDIDPQAVEVTKLSLLLKVLEGESIHSLNTQLKLFQERALPDLGHNIKCGNSLIDFDFYRDHQMALFDDDELYRVNPFDWQAAFPQVFESGGGFDVAVGNPPYISIQSMREWAPDGVVEYYKKHYDSAAKGNFDVYVAFVEQGLRILGRSGRLGFILPSKFLTTDYGTALRARLARDRLVDSIVDFGHDQVFPNATTYTCLLLLHNSGSSSVAYARVSPAMLRDAGRTYGEISLPYRSLGAGPWVLAGDAETRLMDKIRVAGVPLLDIPASMSRGTSTGADDVFCLNLVGNKLFTREGREVAVEEGILRRPLYATDFTRFDFRPRNEQRIIFPYTVDQTGSALIAEPTLEREYPQAHEYLQRNRARLKSRKQYKAWYGYSAPRNLQLHDKAQILVPLLADRGLCAAFESPQDHFCVMASSGFTLSVSNSLYDISPFYVLGLLNSKLLFWRPHAISNKFRGGWVTCTKQYFGTLPIRVAGSSRGEWEEQHDHIVQLVAGITQLKERLRVSGLPQERPVIAGQIATTEQLINSLVYALYGLDEAEIRVVEGVSQVETARPVHIV